MEVPKVFISYSHDSPYHAECVLDLSDRLRKDGIDCHIDQYEVSPSEGWPRWMVNKMEWADFVLVVCTETYALRFWGKAPSGQGKGVKWEGAILSQALYETEIQNTRFIPVVFSFPDTDHIPIILKGQTYYDVSTGKGYEALYRHLTNQPKVLKPTIGELKYIPPLKTKQIDSSFFSRHVRVTEKKHFQKNNKSTVTPEPTRAEFRFSVRQGKQLNEGNVRDASRIEKLVYASKDFIAGPVVYTEWYRAYPDSFTLAFDMSNNSVIGAIIALPVTDEMYDLIADGKTIDSCIVRNDIVPMDLPDHYNLYISDVMVHPEYQRWSKVLPKLIEHFILYLTNRSSEEVFVRRILADVCSDYGTRLCKYIGMPLVRESAHGSHIHEALMLPPSFVARSRLMKELLYRYRSYAQNVICYRSEER